MAGSTLTNSQGSARVIKPVSGLQQVVGYPVSLFNPIRQIGIDCYVNYNWTGTIYIDDVTLN
jgi:hypothetical protein